MNFKKILLIQPMHEKKNNKKKKKKKKKNKQKEKTSISFPWGLATLASYYKASGYDVKLLDGQAMQLAKEKLLPEIDKFDFDVAGITSFSTQYPSVKLFANYIKKNRKVPVIVGGPLASYQAEMVLKTTDADVCVIGEGEIAGIEILKYWKKLEMVKGIAFRQNGKIVLTSSQDRFLDLDQLPLPDFSLFDMERYIRHKNKFAGTTHNGTRAMTVITSRGCPYRCHFCSKSCLSFRSMSPNKLYEMIAALKNEFNLQEIYFGDELFLSSKSKFRELAPRLASLNLPWAGQARVNLVDEEFLELIKKTNCVGLGYGIESGSQKILNNMNKKITVKQIESAMKYTQRLKIPIKVQLIFGYPGEDETTLQETIDLFRQIDHPGRRFNVITPIPGSKLYDDCLSQGLINDEPAYITELEKSFGIGKVHINFTKWPDDEIYPRKRVVEETIFKNYHYKNLTRRAKYYLFKLREK
jgi:radical SAM superfamily enzyme YgiQ (UPF0313 family)